MSKIVEKYWYTPMMGDVIGIIKTYDEITKETKFYIGTGIGADEEVDAEFIKKFGDKFYPEMFNPDF